jgi:hypothetical protein
VKLCAGRPFPDPTNGTVSPDPEVRVSRFVSALGPMDPPFPGKTPHGLLRATLGGEYRPFIHIKLKYR